MTVTINGDTGIAPVTASGTSASVDGMTVGRGGGEVASNTAVGASALNANTSGTGNDAFGSLALTANTSGINNSAHGRGALLSNTTGSYNSAFGYNAAALNTSGANNVAIGWQSLFSNTTASNNTAVGYQAGYNSNASTITAFGYQSLFSNTSGVDNASFGDRALYSNTTGTNNIAMGTVAMQYNTTGGSNTALGTQALRNNTTASANTAVGYQAGYTNSTGAYNVFLGYQAGYTSNASGNAYNLCVGWAAGYSLTTGTQNTFIGGGNGTQAAGGAMTTGSKNTIIGAFNGNGGGLDIRTASNYIVLSDGDGNPRQIIDGNGYVAFGTASTTPTGLNNSIILRPGNASYFSLAGTCASFNRYSTTGIIVNLDYAGTTIGNISTNGSNCTFNSTSDYRLKENVKPMTGALAKVQALKPVTYKWKETQQAGEGFIAHELAEVCPEAVIGKKDEVNEEGKPVYQSIDQSFLIATLTAAIQELKAEVDSLKAQLGK